MAQIKSQMKRIITNEKARQRNYSARSALRTEMKKVKVAVEKKDKAAATAALKNAMRLIDKAVSTHAEHKNTAARQKAEIQKLYNTLK
ncbi:MAG: 30S ribosomal protein S20 [Bacilli bacterium]|nr:30S ribosomal protein S20 [Bacilli bacterium]